jgi:hypothetical protein
VITPDFFGERYLTLNGLKIIFHFDVRLIAVSTNGATFHHLLQPNAEVSTDGPAAE